MKEMKDQYGPIEYDVKVDWMIQQEPIILASRTIVTGCITVTEYALSKRGRALLTCSSINYIGSK